MAVKLKLKLMSEAGVLIYSFNVGYYLVVYVCDGAGGDGGGCWWQIQISSTKRHVEY